MNSAVDWQMSKFGATFARNSKFHIRMTILCQLRDSVTPALERIWAGLYFAILTRQSTQRLVYTSKLRPNI